MVKSVLFILISAHALLHFLGFAKAYSLLQLKSMHLPVSKGMGLLWLLAGILLMITGILFKRHADHAWVAGFIAVIISQLLIIFYWKDAHWGTLPNVVILIACFLARSNHQFKRLTQMELAQMKLVHNKKSEMIQENHLSVLPIAVQNWLRASGIMGKPFIVSGEISQQLTMQLKPEQKNMKATAFQFTNASNPGFIWVVQTNSNAFMWFCGRDKFSNSKGEMLIKLFSLFTVVDEQGKTMDEAALQRYLGEMVWFPSLALNQNITWEALNDSSAKATMNYMGTTGSGIFTFNAMGEVTRFSAMRFKDHHPSAQRMEWIIEVEDYSIFDGIKVPTKLAATWMLPTRKWTWLRMEVNDLHYQYANPSD